MKSPADMPKFPKNPWLRIPVLDFTPAKHVPLLACNVPEGIPATLDWQISQRWPPTSQRQTSLSQLLDINNNNNNQAFRSQSVNLSCSTPPLNNHEISVTIDQYVKINKSAADDEKSVSR